MRTIYFLSALLMTFLVLSCGKATPESMKKQWAANQKQLERLAVEHPNFKNALKEVQNKATTAWTAAEKISDVEKQVDAMSQANRTANPSFVSTLDRLDDKIERLKDDKSKVAQLSSTDPADLNAAKTAGLEAGNTIREINSLLYRQVNTAVEAEALLKKINKKLDGASKRLANVISTAKKKEKAKKDKETAKKNEAKAQQQAKEKKNAKVKCGYCGSMNLPTATTCGGCGAPVK